MLNNLFNKGLCLLIAALLAGVCQAGTMANFNQAFNKVCSKTKQCAMAEIKKEPSMTPDMIKMVESSMMGMCEGIKGQFEPKLFAEHKNILSAATECLNSMAKSSCETMDTADQTPACEKYNKLAEQYN